MHELSLMEDILTTVEKDVQARQFNYVNEVELVVGELSNAMPDALQMAFEIMKAEKKYKFLLPQAILTIHKEEAEAQCIVCNKVYKPDMKIALCPHCDGPYGKIIKGETFQILSYVGGNEDEDNLK